jgi:hypothetical protein
MMMLLKQVSDLGLEGYATKKLSEASNTFSGWLGS